MKTQQDNRNSGNMQGRTTTDRAFTDQKEVQKKNGISNAGGQRSDQTSSRDSAHQAPKSKAK